MVTASFSLLCKSKNSNIRRTLSRIKQQIGAYTLNYLIIYKASLTFNNQKKYKMARIKMTKDGMRAYIFIFGIIMLFTQAWLGLLMLGVFTISILFDKN